MLKLINILCPLVNLMSEEVNKYSSTEYKANGEQATSY